MNFYPYLSSIPYMSAAAPVAKAGIFKSLFGSIKWGSIISGTQKTLGVVNQAIPLIKQARPVINNAKTMFKVMNEFKKMDIPDVPTNNVVNTDESVNTINNIVNNNSASQGPTFFQ